MSQQNPDVAAELERLRGKILELIAQKSDLIAVLAHDIKGPLTSIVGFSELLEEGYLEGDSATDAAKTIHSNANRLTTLTNDMLALSRVESGELEMADERIDLIELLGKAIEARRPERQIELNSDAAAAFVRGDADRLIVVFDNLLRNAIRFSPNGDPVSVTLRLEDDRVLVAVRDHGIGVPPDERAKLFTRFGRTSNARKAKLSGTGVGLYVAQKILERHDATIAVTSAIGTGSTFEVTFRSFAASLVADPKRVTVLCGDVESSHFITFELRSRGFRVREVTTVADAVAGDLRSGDVILFSESVAPLKSLREALPADRDVRLVLLGRPFLISEILAELGTKRPGRTSVQA